MELRGHTLPAPRPLRVGRVPHAWPAAAWLGLALLVALGAGAWIHQLTNGLAVTGMRDDVSWGLYVATFAVFAGLASGGLIVASAAEAFGASSLLPVARLGALTAVAASVVAALAVVPNLGRPERLANIVLHPNPSSPLLWDALAVAGCIGVSVACLVARPRRALAFTGLAAAVLLQGATASVFALQSARPLWNNASLVPLGIASAVVSGTALVIVVASASDGPARAARDALCTLLAAAIAVELLLAGASYAAILWGDVPRRRAALELILPGGDLQWLFWVQWIAGGVVPLVLLVAARTRRSAVAVTAASALAIAGVCAFWLETVVGGLLRPLLHLPPGIALGASETAFRLDGSYRPLWVEYAIVAGLIALLAAALAIACRRLRPR